MEPVLVETYNVIELRKYILHTSYLVSNAVLFYASDSIFKLQVRYIYFNVTNYTASMTYYIGFLPNTKCLKIRSVLTGVHTYHYTSDNQDFFLLPLI